MNPPLDLISVPGDGVDLDALAVKGSGNAPARPPILFIHENRGLVPYMRDVITALGAEGHRVVAPDLLSRVGGTDSYAAAPDDISTRVIPNDVHVRDLVSVHDWMNARHGDLVVLGFCFGAEMGWQLLTHRTPERAALLYGIGPDPAEVTAITTRVYAAYAEHDPRVNGPLEAMCRSLSASTTDMTLESFPGTHHAFHDHTRPDRYSAGAASRLWARVIDFLG